MFEWFLLLAWWQKLRFCVGHSCKLEQAKLGQNGLRISYFRKFLIKHAGWGVLIFLLLSYRIPASHTTPFMFQEYVKETRRPCRQVSHRWNVSFIICGALRLETAPNPSPVDSEKSLGPYRIDMQTVQLQVCDQAFMPKKKKKKPWLHSWYISL